MIGAKKSAEDFTLSALSLVELNRVLIRIGELLSQAHGIGQHHDMHGSRIVNVGSPAQTRDAINKQALDDGLEPKTEGPDLSTDNAVVRWDGNDGRKLQNSIALIDDAGSVNIPAGQTYKIDGVPHTHAFDDLSDVDFTDEAHGDLAFRGADKWNNLPAGDAGQVLTSRGDGADPTWEDFPGTVDLATLIHGATEKPSLADNDEFPMTDSADTYALKKMLASDLKAALKTYFDTMYLTSLEASWPVGSIFLSVVATSPRILLGFGTWLRIAEGKFLVGQEAADEDFDTAEKTGGEKTHKLTSAEMPEHTHVQNPHQHDLSSLERRLATGTATTWDIFADINTSSAYFDPGTYLIPAATAINQNTGGGAAHNNLPPYTVVYAWKRLSSYWPSGYWPSGYWPEGYWPN